MAVKVEGQDSHPAHVGLAVVADGCADLCNQASAHKDEHREDVNSVCVNELVHRVSLIKCLRDVIFALMV
jgi:hypothetical protein